MEKRAMSSLAAAASAATSCTSVKSNANDLERQQQQSQAMSKASGGGTAAGLGGGCGGGGTNSIRPSASQRQQPQDLRIDHDLSPHHTQDMDDQDTSSSPTDSGGSGTGAVSSSSSGSQSKSNSGSGSGGNSSPNTTTIRRLPSVLRPPPGSQQHASARDVLVSSSSYDQPLSFLGTAAAASSHEYENMMHRATFPDNNSGSSSSSYSSSSSSSNLNNRNHLPYYNHQLAADVHSHNVFGRERMRNNMSAPIVNVDTTGSNGNSPQSRADRGEASANMDGGRGQKRQLTTLDRYPSNRPIYESHVESQMTRSSSNDLSSRGRGEDASNYGPIRGSHGPRDETRYETWTSKQLRKKCSHLKLRGLKNVKKHVMVEALYRYYRQLRQKEANERGESMSNQDVPSVGGASGGVNSMGESSQTSSNSSREALPSSNVYRPRYDHIAAISSNRMTPSDHTTTSGGGSSNSSGSMRRNGRLLGTNKMFSMNNQQRQQHNVNDDEVKMEMNENDTPVTPEDVIRLVDVVLSSEFVDRLAGELSRWQFWVDVREKYVAMLKVNGSNSVNAMNGTGGNGAGSGGNNGTFRVDNDKSVGVMTVSSRNFKWSSMQLWEMWKELTFAYTKACYNFTAAGAEEREYIKYCEGRPDVYYLHQRLHARPDLLHLIKSNEYIAEKCTSDANESIIAESGSPSRAHKRLRRIMAAASPSTKSYGNSSSNDASGGSYSSTDKHSNGSNGNETTSSGEHMAAESGSSPIMNTREEGSTENSETTGEEGSLERNMNQGDGRQEALAEQKYFGMLLQNFEAIFESLHNKKILLAALRKDSNAPDHLIADLHDDIHVLSALKKEYRNKLRRTLE